MAIDIAVAAPAPRSGGTAAGLKPIFDLVANDFAAVNQLIPKQLTSDVEMVEAIGRHIVESGGKRLRPLLVLLCARCCNYPGVAHVRLATVIEFLHTATLLHDDVVDRSERRRGQATANAVWGNAPSVLVGDFLYSRAFQLMVELDDMDILSILSDATNTIAQGEVMQLANVGNSGISEHEYMEVIRCKTALLFQASCHTAAVLASDNPAHIQAMQAFGKHFGLAYQLVDDWLDYAGDAETMGKNIGDDLAEGKLTLPLIHALAKAPASQRQVLRNAVQARSAEAMDSVLDIVSASGALEYTRDRAHDQGMRAMNELRTLPANEHRDALDALTRFSIDRLS